MFAFFLQLQRNWKNAPNLRETQDAYDEEKNENTEKGG